MKTFQNEIPVEYRQKKCLCGCGELLKIHKYFSKNGGYYFTINKFIKGHHKRGINGFNPIIHSPQLCACGCGAQTKKLQGKFNKFIKGHENIGRTPWNKGGKFSKEAREKMSLARIGKEPVNKVNVNLKKLYQLYVKEKRTVSFICGDLGISKDVVKNRLRVSGWSRSTKESCSTKEFKNRMRKIRVKTLSSGKQLETPNKLEQLAYNCLGEFNVPYKKQVPLFEKFVVDALIPQKKLIIEIFGKYWHEMPNIAKKDHSKKKYLEKCGYKVEEIWDYEIKKYTAENVLRKLLSRYNLV